MEVEPEVVVNPLVALIETVGAFAAPGPVQGMLMLTLSKYNCSDAPGTTAAAMER